MTPEDRALLIATAVTRMFEQFARDTVPVEPGATYPATPPLETIRILTTAEVYKTALVVLEEPRAEA